MTGILWIVAAILVIAWIIGFVLVHVASFAIHILIILAIILVVWNLIQGSRRSV